MYGERKKLETKNWKLKTNFGGECCPCPLHANHHSTDAELVSVTGNISLHKRDSNGALQPLGTGSEIKAGEAVYVAGHTADTVPWASEAVFSWTMGGGETRMQTNAFTALGVNLITGWEVHGGISSNAVVKSLFPPRGGIIMTGEHDKSGLVEMEPFVGLSGTRTLTLESSDAAVRAAGSPGGATFLTPGQSRSDIAGFFHVESDTPGDATLTWAFQGDASASNLACTAVLPLTLAGIRPQPG
jgi:hypothetical protein